MIGIKMQSCIIHEFTFDIVHSRQQVTYDVCSSKMFVHALC
jgi:hypothetical protein